MRGRSLLWAGPGALLLGSRGAKGELLGTSSAGDGCGGADATELAVAASEDLLVAQLVASPAAPDPAPCAPAFYAGSSVTKTRE